MGKQRKWSSNVFKKRVGKSMNSSITQYEAVTFNTFISMTRSFVSLDISKTSTGWVKWLNGELSYGTFTIKSPDSDGVSQRKEFKEHLRSIFLQDDFEYLFIEDIIGSVNFRTARVLYQLNPIADDLIEDGVLSVGTLVRESNKVWKKYLKLASNYKPKYKASKNDKELICNALHSLGFNASESNKLPQDIYDALGLAIGVIYRLKVLNQSTDKSKAKTNIASGYNLMQFDDKYSALDFANTLNRKIIDLDFLGSSRDLVYNFKRYMEVENDDKNVFLIEIEINRIGVLAIKNNFDLNVDVSYILVYRSKVK